MDTKHGYLASRAPANGAPIAILVTRMDDGTWTLLGDEEPRGQRHTAPAGETIYATEEEARAAAVARWGRR